MTAFAPSVREVLAMTLMVSTPASFDGRPMRVNPFCDPVIQDDAGAGLGEPAAMAPPMAPPDPVTTATWPARKRSVIDLSALRSRLTPGPFSVNHLSDYEC